MPISSNTWSFNMGQNPLEFISGKPIKVEGKKEITIITNANVDAHDFDIWERAILAKHMREIK